MLHEGEGAGAGHEHDMHGPDRYTMGRGGAVNLIYLVHGSLEISFRLFTTQEKPNAS